MFNHTKLKLSQSGAALFVCLMLLTVMTLLGISAVTTTTLEEKMAASLRNKSLSEGGAESALRAAEDYLWNYYATSNGLALVADEAATSTALSLTSLPVAFAAGARSASVSA